MIRHRVSVGGNLLKRFHLAIIIICQVTIVPTFLFSIAYLIDIDLDNASIGLRTEMISWIIVAGVTIGENSIIAGQVGIAGSSIIGNNVKIGGQAGISGHLKIGNNVHIGGGN